LLCVELALLALGVKETVAVFDRKSNDAVFSCPYLTTADGAGNCDQ
jgi:hypothetical protein